ncbi:MAG: 16S rRNA (cytosine(1402)-N(4))-methyltransferase RsmH [Clostridia bacterium]
MEFKHVSIMLDECMEGLDIKPDGIYVDGTLGGAGHSLKIISKLNKNGKLIGIDRDNDALTVATERLKQYTNFIPVHSNYSEIISILKNLNINGVDGVLMDLGVSSFQLDEAERGFSYMKDAPLDMRMDREDKLTARDIVNKYPEAKLANVIYDFGDEKYSRQIAKKICDYRSNIKEIETTLELVKIIKSAMPARALNEKQHPAKRTFQAIRIEVNNEIGALKQTIIDDILSLNPDGRIAIITFHSLEDKIVKHTFNEMQGKCTCPSDFPVCICNVKSYGKVITKKAIVPSDEEIKENPRARSAKLRVFKRI